MKTINGNGKHEDKKSPMLQQEKAEIKIAGFGGQGVILSGIILGKAACIFEGLNSTLIQSFGPEARGGACSAQVVVSPQPINYPYIKEADILVVMSQEAFRLFSPGVRKGGLILYESELVDIKNCPEMIRCYGVPATSMAEEIRSKILLNIVMLGFYTAFTRDIVSAESMRKSIKRSVPTGTESFNLRAFTRGYRYGKDLLKKESSNCGKSDNSKPGNGNNNSRSKEGKSHDA
ncbi:MAG: 2-oxoacid:acceptor oxidoreductase family protein [Pseudomonadota bacterium]